jgi:hypothetical protein
MEPRTTTAALAAGSGVSIVDLGLGVDVRATVAKAADYRSMDRVTDLVVGSPSAALAATRAARARSSAVLAVMLGVVAAHARARSDAGMLALARRGCAFESAWCCTAAADLRGANGDLQGDFELRARACELGSDESCRLAVAQRAALGAWSPDGNLAASCARGEIGSCRVLDLFEPVGP